MLNLLLLVESEVVPLNSLELVPKQVELVRCRRPESGKRQASWLVLASTTQPAKECTMSRMPKACRQTRQDGQTDRQTDRAKPKGPDVGRKKDFRGIL